LKIDPDFWFNFGLGFQQIQKLEPFT